jgi:tetratricopeptide (TPR) repeat protein
MRRDDPERALHFLQRAVSLRPSFIEAHFAVAQLYEAQGKWEAALEHSQYILQKHAFHAGALNGKAQAARHLGRVEAEEEALLQLLSIANRNPRQYLRVARFYERIGKQDRARQLIEIAEQLAGKEPRPEMRPLLPSPR